MAMSKDEIYGPPPAYSVHPPSSIYTIPHTQNEYEERTSSHASFVLSTNYRRYLLGTGVFHILIGITSIVCDILLMTMNESYSYPGLWAGSSCIILGIYFILFMTDSTKQKCSFQRFKFLHILICLIIIIAVVLSALNLTSNSCSTSYFQFDQCYSSPQKFKIILLTFFAFTSLQICINFLVTFIYVR